VTLVEKFLTHLYRSILFLPGTWISCVAWSPQKHLRDVCQNVARDVPRWL